MRFNKKQVYERLSTVIDPELMVNIVDLGLIYEVLVMYEGDELEELRIKMTLTTPGCPLAPIIHSLVEDCLEDLPDYSKEKLMLLVVFDPPWTVDMMNEETRIELGLDEF